jgi:EmrB/QacA subfamily drug resistance transporter
VTAPRDGSDDETRLPEPAVTAGPAITATERRLAIAALMCGTIATVLSATLINVALATFMADMGVGHTVAQGLSTGFLAANTIAMPVAPWMMGRLGFRKLYILAIAVFVAAALLGGFAPGAHAAIAARVIQGAAAGMIQPLAMVVIFRMYPPDKRGAAMGLYGLGVVLAPALAPSLGGALVEFAGWRSVFFVAIPVCLVGMGLAMKALPDARPAGAGGRFDGLGFVLLATALVSLIGVLSLGKSQGWVSLPVLGLVVLCVAAAAAFLAWERRVTRPLMDLKIYRAPGFAAAALCSMTLGLGLFGSTYLLPLLLETARGMSPAEVGLAMAPGGFAMAAMFPIAGRLADRMPARPQVMIGLGCFALHAVLITWAEFSAGFWVIAGIMAFGRMSLALVMPALSAGGLRLLGESQVAQGAAALNVGRQFGGAVGVAILAVVLETAEAALPGQTMEAFAITLMVMAGFGLTAMFVALRLPGRV